MSELIVAAPITEAVLFKLEKSKPRKIISS